MQDLSVPAVADEIEKHFRPLTDPEAVSLTRYLELLLHWNRKMNLIGPMGWRTVCRELILDSLHLAECLPSLPLPASPHCLDIGSGAGIPGLPLRIVWSAGSYVLVEPRTKRATFLRFAVASLGLDGIRVAEKRVEDLSGDFAGADLILSRAFRPWQEVLSSLGHLLGAGGLLLIFSNAPWQPGQDCPAGWRLSRQHRYSLDRNRQRYFWFFSPMT